MTRFMIQGGAVPERGGDERARVGQSRGGREWDNDKVHDSGWSSSGKGRSKGKGKGKSKGWDSWNSWDDWQPRSKGKGQSKGKGKGKRGKGGDVTAEGLEDEMSKYFSDDAEK